MTPTARLQAHPARRAAIRWVVAAVALLVGACLSPGAGTAQVGTQVGAIETERRLAYQAATDAYNGALGARAAAEARFSRLAQQIEVARASGNETQRNQALAEAQRLTSELLGLDQRVAETAQELETTREAYLEILDVRLDLLAEQIGFAPSAADSAQLGAMYRDLQIRFVEVERDARGALELVPVMMPEITREPRDGPVELRAKADLLERRAEQADSVIAYIDAQLEDLERRARRERSVRELVRGLERFGTTDVPVVARTTSDEGQPENVEETPEERIQSLGQVRAVYMEQRDEARRRADEFRRLAGGGR